MAPTRAIFDLDGTLADTMPVHFRAWCDVGARFGVALPIERFYALGGVPTLTIARTLMGNPYLVLLDEPSEGVAPVIVEQMAHMILALKAQGVSILLSEQNMHFAELVSDRAYVLEKGQIRYQATMKELSHNDEVRRAYLSV